MNVEIAQAQTLLSKKRPNPDKAIKTLRPLLKRSATSWLVYHYLGVAYLQKNDNAKAQGYLLKALNLGADQPETFHLMAVVLYNLGQFDDSIDFSKKATSLKQDFLEAWIQLGACYRAKADLENAIKAYTEANQIDPQNAGIAYRIGSIYLDQGDLKKARELYEITVQMDSNFIEAYLGQALIFQKLQDYQNAKTKIEEVLQFDPTNRLALISLAVVYKDWGKYSEAIALNEQLLRKNPKDGRLRVNYALCLLETGQFNKAEENYLRALEDSPEVDESLSNYLMGIHYNPERTKEEIFEAHLLWDQHFAPKERAQRLIPTNIDPDRKLRIGFISGGFRKHPVGWMITRAIENLSREHFEVYCYTTHALFDDITRSLRTRSDKWISVLGYNDQVVANLIQEDDIDILVELSGHSAFNRLKTIALEPAPITLKWVGGLFNTTGLESMDYLLTDHYETPEGEEEFYTEKLVKMPDDYVCYQPPQYPIAVAKLPALYNGYITFGCFNNPSKLNNELLEKWAEILQEVPGSKLFLKSKQYETTAFVDNIIQQMAKHGINQDRLQFEGYAMHEDLLCSYNQVDISLDPWPYSGGLTTCEALWMGVPVVAISGPTFAGRHSTTHLINAGYGDWVAKDWTQYKKIALRWANDVEALSAIRKSMRAQFEASPVCDGARFGAHLGQAFKEMWAQRVAGYESNLPEGEWQDHISVKTLSEDQIQQHRERIEKENKFQKNHTLIPITNHLKLSVPEAEQSITAYRSEEQKQLPFTEFAALDILIKEEDYVLEIGAGYGLESMQMAHAAGEKGMVIALEPNDELAAHLEESARLNGFNSYKVFPLAASNYDGSGCLSYADEPEWSRLSSKGKCNVQVTTVDQLWKSLDMLSVDVLKIDVNGGELQVLEGATEFLSAVKPALILSTHENPEQIRQLNTTAGELGYELYEFIPGVGQFTQLEDHPERFTSTLYAFTAEQKAELIQKDRIFISLNEEVIPEQGAGLRRVEYQTWAKRFIHQWISSSENDFESLYLSVFDVVAESLNRLENPFTDQRSRAANRLITAATILIDAYPQRAQLVPMACTLTRVLLTLGKREQAETVARQTMQFLLSGQAEFGSKLPFVPQLPQQESMPVYSAPENWLKVKATETWLLTKELSTQALTPRDLAMVNGLSGNPDVLPLIDSIKEWNEQSDEVPSNEVVQPTMRPKKSGGRFVHIAYNHVYAKSLSDLLVHTNAHSEQEHVLWIEENRSILNYDVDARDNPNAFRFNSLENMDPIINECLHEEVDGIFFHGVFFDWQKQLIKAINHQKQTAWILWGGDLYRPIQENKPMRFIASMVNHILTPIEGDISMFKSVYGNRQSHAYGYPYPGLYGDLPTEFKKQEPPLIIVGNSGDDTNNHAEILIELARKKDIHNYELNIPVSYNSNIEYEQMMLKLLKKLKLDKQTKLVKTFLSPEEYFKLMNRASMLITAHDRQQAIGNMLAALYSGNHTFLKKEIILDGKKMLNPSWEFLESHGFKVNDFNQLSEIKTLSELSEIDGNVVKKHQQILNENFGLEVRSRQLIQASEKILAQSNIEKNQCELVE